MAIQGIFYVTAAVSNLARAKKFYGETLGWQLNTDETYVGGLYFGTGYLIIHEASSPRGGSTYVTVRVDDVSAERELLSARGVAVSELKDEHWGERNFRFSDPDGNLWVYAQPIER